MRNLYLKTLATLLPAALLITGCGLGSVGDVAKAPGTGGGSLAITGNIHGGQQPVKGATVNMYAVGTTGYGSPSVSVLNAGVTVTSANDGTFLLTNKFTCTPDQRVYITATGGDAGSGPNASLGLMAALGRCGDLTSATFIQMNEITTVASIWALAPFMHGPANIGAPLSNVTGLNNAFNDVNTLANISAGTAGGSGLPAGTLIPVKTINTLADIIAACINSTGADNGCSTLFAGATVNSSVPTDTLTAAMNIAQHPANGVATLFPLATPQSPFQLALSEQPSDFTLAVNFTGFTTPTAVAADAGGRVWVTDSTANTLTQLSHTGAPLITTTGLHTPSAVAIDQSGSAWVANAGNSSLLRVTSTGVPSTFTGGGLSTPQSISIDGQGNIWLANSGNNSVSEFDNSGTPLSGSGFTSTGGTPIAVAINPN